MKRWLAALLLALPSQAAADARNVRFERLSLEQGLSQNHVNTLLQDRRGFMWFGTQDGLNRYDGYRFRVYKHDPADRNTLSNDAIWALLEDRDGTLWIGTDGGGLNRLDVATETFRAYRHDKDEPKSLSSDRVRALLETRDGVLWVGTDGGLNRFDRASGTFIRFRHHQENPNSLSNDRVRSLMEDRDGALWIGTDGGGLNRFEPATGQFQRFRHDPADPRSLGSDRVRSVFQDRDGVLWIATYEAGLNRMQRGTFERFRHDRSDPGSLIENRVRSIYQDRSGVLWIGTDRGLDEWEPETRTFIHHRHDEADPRSLGDDRVMAVYQDRGGVLWVATGGGGVSKWNMATRSFELVRVDPKAASTLTSNTVNALYASGAHVLWIGTHAGLNRLDRRTGRFTSYRHDPRNPRSLSDDRVMSLRVDRAGRLWVGTYEGGLNLLDEKTQTFRRYRHDPADESSLSANGITSIYEDRDGMLWVGAFRGGLNRLNPETGKVVRYRHDPADPSSLADDDVITLFEDAAGGLWVGMDGGALDRLDRKSGRFTHYDHDPGNADSVGSDIVFAVHEDRRGTLWVGTQGGGLARWDAADREAGRVVFRHYTERHGLANDTVYAILEDEAGDLWLSTNRGLSRLDPVSDTFRNFDVSHGLASSEFNFGAYHRASTGEMFFGTNAGFNAFLPERALVNGYVPPVVLTSFQKLNRDVPPAEIAAAPEMVVTYRDYVVSFEYAALDYASPERNRYAYRLEGLDQDWVPASSTERRATYTNLAPGRYVFRVKGSNGDGIWNEDGLAVRVTVLPPPWRTWWAYGLYVLAIAAALGTYVRAQARRLEREAEYSHRLELEVKERTVELAQRNEELQHANRRLEDASLSDSLTGLNNRRFLMAQVQQDVALVDRYYRKLALGVEIVGEERPDFALMMIDLDGLKGLNDFYGHAAGDQVLVQMRDILERACRKSDTIVRWGGDEFLVLARYADGDVTAALAERIRRAVEEHSFDLPGAGRVHLRCSIGWALYPLIPKAHRLVTWEQVGTIADRALYAAKTSGRNAWVGLLSTITTPFEETVHLINQRPHVLVREGALEVRTSLTTPDAIVWDRHAASRAVHPEARGILSAGLTA